MENKDSGTQEVSITPNSASLTLGIISIVIAVFALLVSWVPFLGLIAIPAAVVGILLAGIGILIALIKGGRGMLMPLLGGFLCVLPIVVSVGMTGAISSGVSTAIDEAAAIRDDKMASALSGLEIQDVQWGRVESDYTNTGLKVSYKLKNASDINIKTVSTRVRFYDSEGVELGHNLEYPVSILDSDLHPGNVVKKKSTMFDYSDIPAEDVKSVTVEIETISVD